MTKKTKKAFEPAQHTQVQNTNETLADIFEQYIDEPDIRLVLEACFYIMSRISEMQIN